MNVYLHKQQRSNHTIRVRSSSSLERRRSCTHNIHFSRVPIFSLCSFGRDQNLNSTKCTAANNSTMDGVRNVKQFSSSFRITLDLGAASITNTGYITILREYMIDQGRLMHRGPFSPSASKQNMTDTIIFHIAGVTLYISVL